MLLLAQIRLHLTCLKSQVQDRVRVHYKKNAATDSTLLAVGTSDSVLSSGFISLTLSSWTDTNFYFVAPAATSYIVFRENRTSDNAEIWIDELEVLPVTPNELFVTDDLSLTQGIFDVDVTIPTTTDGQAGIVLCLDSESSPANYITALYNRVIGKVELYKTVAGVGTQLISTTATYSAGSTLRCVVDYVTATDDVKIKVYYNGALISTEQLIEDNGIAGNTRHGIMSVDSSNSLDNFTVHTTAQTVIRIQR